MEEKTKHHELQNTAIRWLYGTGCSVFAQEVPTKNGIADALGIRTRDEKHTVYYIEAKSSRSDLICPKQKAVYARSCGQFVEYCMLHRFSSIKGKEFYLTQCDECQKIHDKKHDTGIDFYYFIVADGVLVEDSLYPTWGVINENGKVIRRAKRMSRDGHTQYLLEKIAHVLVYKVFGKLYL